MYCNNVNKLLYRTTISAGVTAKNNIKTCVLKKKSKVNSISSKQQTISPCKPIIADQITIPMLETVTCLSPHPRAQTGAAEIGSRRV